MSVIRIGNFSTIFGHKTESDCDYKNEMCFTEIEEQFLIENEMSLGLTFMKSWAELSGKQSFNVSFNLSVRGNDKTSYQRRALNESMLVIASGDYAVLSLVKLHIY